MKCGLYNVVTTLIIGASTLVSCYSVMLINTAKTSKENKSAAKTVIAYYDPAIGTDAIETFVNEYKRRCSQYQATLPLVQSEQSPVCCLLRHGMGSACA